MSCALIILAFLFGVLPFKGGLSNGEATDEHQAQQWVDALDVEMVNERSRQTQVLWNYYVNITDENGRLAHDANLRLAQFDKEACMNASRYRWKEFTDPSLTRRFRFISSDCSRLTDEEIIALEKLKGNLTAIYSTAEVCKSGNVDCMPKEPNLTRLMAESRDWEELLWAWEGWRNVSGKPMKPNYIEMVSFLNKDARLRGHQDFGDFWRSKYDMENFAAACEQLWQQVKPLYEQLHVYVRRRLMQSYPNNLPDFPSSRHIPAHILGGIHAYKWDKILDLVKPFPNSSAIDLTKILKEKGYNARRMVREAESFFTSLGLPAMPQEFWNHSMIEKPTDGRQVVCHASAWDFNNRRDFRIKQCTDVTEEYFSVTHHEMGHIQYYLSYKHQPVIFQDGANPGFHEAIGDVISMSVNTPQHLRKINLISDSTDDYEFEINFLMKQALNKVAFLPFGYLMDLWRWGVFNGTIAPKNYNKRFWKLRCDLQGLSPPVTRSEEDFDIASMYHISENFPYISYYVAHIILFQFHKSLCEDAGHVGPLYKCDIYNSTAAGDRLRRMMSLGSTKPWPDAMEIMTGQRNMDAGPLLEYFRPLQQWLENENKGHDVGWVKGCPCGYVRN